MDAWVLWLIAAGVLVIAEVLTTSLLFAMIAGGAASAAVVAALGGGSALQFGAFALVSFALVVLVRPVATRHMRTPPAIRTGVAALVGSEAEVLESVDGRDGRIKLAGEIWSARSYNGETVHEPGALVRVVMISGATALVD
jgi:membrane protein implicated in regulation of membrane protease activity